MVYLFCPRTWSLFKEAVGVLIEGTPADVDLTKLRENLEKVEGVSNIRDLHVWSLISGINAMNVHAVSINEDKHGAVMRRFHEFGKSEFKIQHASRCRPNAPVTRGTKRTGSGLNYQL